MAQQTKILVTGAGGFIGHHLVKYLKGQNYWVRGVLLRKASRYRLVLAIHLIQHAAAVEIDSSDVVPV